MIQRDALKGRSVMPASARLRAGRGAGFAHEANSKVDSPLQACSVRPVSQSDLLEAAGVAIHGTYAIGTVEAGKRWTKTFTTHNHFQRKRLT